MEGRGSRAVTCVARGGLGRVCAKGCWRGGGMRGRSGLVRAVRGGMWLILAVRATPEPYSTTGRAGEAGRRVGSNLGAHPCARGWWWWEEGAREQRRPL